MSEFSLQTKFAGMYLAESLATNFNQQKANKDPVLFPSIANDEVIKNWPLTVILTGDFDIYREGAVKFADRLDKAGRLCEFISYSGSMQCHFENPAYNMSLAWYEDLASLMDKYVI